MKAVALLVALAVALLVARFAWLFLRRHWRPVLALAVAALIAFPFAWHLIGRYHLFAPPDPYGPCPPPTQYHSGWLPLDGFDAANGSPGEPVPDEQEAGVVVYHGWVELAGCGMSIHMSAG